MAKRGEARPYRMSYTWTDTGIRGTQAFQDLDAARMRAQWQAATVSGQTGEASCVAIVVHRDHPDVILATFRGADVAEEV